MKKTNIKKKNKVFNFELLPAVLLFVLLPVMVKGTAVRTYLDHYSWFPAGEFQYDFFIYGKSIFFLILVLGMLFVLVGRILIQQKKQTGWKRFLPLIFYGGLVLLSSFLSVNRDLSLHGMWQQNESLWILLGYMVTVYYTWQVVETAGDLRIILYALAVGAVLQCILGLLQLCGRDFFCTEIGKIVLTWGLDPSIREKLVFTFENESNLSVYLASYNPNYAGGYLVLVLPVLAALACSIKRRIGKSGVFILCILLFVCLYGCGSKTGFAVFGILVLVAAWLLPRTRSRKLLVFACCLAVVAAGTAGYDISKNHSLVRAAANTVKKISAYDLEDIETQKDGVTLTYKGERLKIVPHHTDAGDMIQVLKEGEKTSVTALWDMEQQCFRIPEESCRDLRMDFSVIEENQCLQIICNDISWNFVKSRDEDGYVYINRYGKADKIEKAESVLKGYERAFTRRGYLWGRTLPLIRGRILWGSGPDTFAVVFPQTDYVMRANAGKAMLEEIPTKAHNMYLQTALQTGVLSLLCLLVFWGGYIRDYFRQQKERRKKGLYMIQTGLFLSITGYLLMGLLNDSNLATAPVFWALLGTGAASLKLREERPV